MFRTSYVHHQEDYTVHAALYGMFSIHLCKQPSGLKDVPRSIPYKAACTSTKSIHLKGQFRIAQ